MQLGAEAWLSGGQADPSSGSRPASRRAPTAPDACAWGASTNVRAAGP